MDCLRGNPDQQKDKKADNQLINYDLHPPSDEDFSAQDAAQGGVARGASSREQGETFDDFSQS